MVRKRFVFGVVFFTAHVAVAQFKNIQLDKQSERNRVCEPSIAINPRNTKNIVAASVLNNIYVSGDGGANWSTSKVESPLGVYGDPALIADAGGNFYFFHLSDPTNGKGGYDSEKLDRIVSHVSTDNGKTWSEGYSIGLNTPKDQDKPWPSIDAKGNLYVTWTQFDKYGDSDPGCKSVILMSSSKNGRKWSDPIQISPPGDCLDNDKTVMGAMSAHVDGKSFVAWSYNEMIYIDRSYDGTTWLSNDIAVAQQVGGWDLKIPGHDRSNGLPVLLTAKGKTSNHGHLYLLWADQRRGADNTDVWITTSANYGDNWSSPIRVNNDATVSHQYLPWMCMDQATGFLYVVYYDRSEHDNLSTDVYLAWSKDGGLSFRNVKISESSFTPDAAAFFGDYTNIAAHNGVIAPVWTRMDDGKTSVWTTVITQSELDKIK